MTKMHEEEPGLGVVGGVILVCACVVAFFGLAALIDLVWPMTL